MKKYALIRWEEDNDVNVRRSPRKHPNPVRSKTKKPNESASIVFSNTIDFGRLGNEKDFETEDWCTTHSVLVEYPLVRDPLQTDKKPESGRGQNAKDNKDKGTNQYKAWIVRYEDDLDELKQILETWTRTGSVPFEGEMYGRAGQRQNNAPKRYLSSDDSDEKSEEEDTKRSKRVQKNVHQETLSSMREQVGTVQDDELRRMNKRLKTENEQLRAALSFSKMFPKIKVWAEEIVNRNTRNSEINSVAIGMRTVRVVSEDNDNLVEISSPERPTVPAATPPMDSPSTSSSRASTPLLDENANYPSTSSVSTPSSDENSDSPSRSAPIKSPKSVYNSILFGYQVDKNGYCNLGSGVKVPAVRLASVSTKNLQSTVYGLCTVIFTQTELLTSSLTGKASNAFPDKKKEQLDPIKVDTLIRVCRRMQPVSSTVEDHQIRLLIGKKLNICTKMANSKMAKSGNKNNVS